MTTDLTPDLTPDQRRQLLRKLLERQVRHAQRFPTSFGQRRIWLLDQFDPGNAVYNMPLAVRLGGRLHVDLFERALQSLVRRHDAMRTRFEGVDGEPEQVVDTDDRVSLAVIDISGTDSEDEVLRRAREEATRPFRLAEGPLFRATLFRLGPEDHLLVFVMHHIVSDAWSMSVA
ncbi:MAG: condensation protein, partial [Planctomycetaceae bacterium]